MASFNRVILLGNLTRDVELKYTPKGVAVAEISIAVNHHYTKENGEKCEEVTFVEITFWGRTAEIAGEYLKKGAPCHVEGRLKLDTWDDKETGKKRSKLRVIGESLQLLGSKGSQPKDEEDPRERRQQPKSTSQGQGFYQPPQKPKDPDLDPPEDDIPF